MWRVPTSKYWNVCLSFYDETPRLLLANTQTFGVFLNAHISF